MKDTRPSASVTRPKIGTGSPGVVYVLHFDRPVLVWHAKREKHVHVRHYIGWSQSVAMMRRRHAYHEAGQGAKLLKAAAEQGITWTLAVVFRQADRYFERYLHARKNTPQWCPCCCKERAERRTHRRVRKLRVILRSAITGRYVKEISA